MKTYENKTAINKSTPLYRVSINRVEKCIIDKIIVLEKHLVIYSHFDKHDNIIDKAYRYRYVSLFLNDREDPSFGYISYGERNMFTNKKDANVAFRAMQKDAKYMAIGRNVVIAHKELQELQEVDFL